MRLRLRLLSVVFRETSSPKVGTFRERETFDSASKSLVAARRKKNHTFLSTRRPLSSVVTLPRKPKIGTLSLLRERFYAAKVPTLLAPHSSSQTGTLKHLKMDPNTIQTALSYLSSFLTLSFVSASTGNLLQCFFMALQGATTARKTLASRKKPFTWFKALALTSILSFGGAWFAPLLVGKPSKMLASEVNAPVIVLAFYLLFYSPMDTFYKISTTLPFTIVTTAFAQLFRAGGVVAFVNLGNSMFSAGDIYPIPVIGPILLASMLGNMGALFLKGYEEHTKNGMPWAFQNGLWCASFYHFFTNDEVGPIGIGLRTYLGALFGGEGVLMKNVMDDENFAKIIISGFMVLVGVLQLPAFFGPSFNPFNPLSKFVVAILGIEDRNARILNEGDRVVSVPSTKSKKKKSKAE